MFRLITVSFILLSAAVSQAWASDRPDEKVDYLAKMNQHVRYKGVADKDNGILHLQKAIELYVETDDLGFDWYALDRGKYDCERLKKFRKWIKDNEPAWQEYQKFAKAEYSWPKYVLTKEDDFAGTVDFEPGLFPIRQIAKMAASKADLALLDNEIDEAINIYGVIIESASKMYRPEITVIEQLVWNSVVSIGFEGMTFIVANENLNDQQLTAIEKRLQKIYPDGFKVCGCTGEKLHWIHTIENGFDDQGRVKIDFLKYMTYLDTFVHKKEFDYKKIRRIHASKKEILDALQKDWDYYEKNEFNQYTPYEIYSQNIDTGKMLSDLDKDKYFILTYQADLFKAFPSVYVHHKHEARHNALVLILAIKRYQIKQKKLPENLQQLVDGGYLSALPQDPFNKGPLQYKKTGKDFILYSIGDNFKDDNGKAWDYESEKDKDCDDIVFWPVKDKDPDPMLSEEE